MKASYHNGRIGNPRHNDRTFDIKKAKHIDEEKMALNKYVCVHPEFLGDREKHPHPFAEAEKKFYSENFAEYLDQWNEKVRKQRNYSRRKNVNDLLNGSRTKPEETIIQLGNIDDHPEDRGILLDIFNELQSYSNKITHHHCKILDAALHMDESTPHIHLRKVWMYKENGINMIGQEKALEHAGIGLPYPDLPASKYNNRKMVYDAMMRERLYQLCKERGLEIDEVPDPNNRVHLTKEQYVEKILADRERAEKKREKEKEKRQ